MKNYKKTMTKLLTAAVLLVSVFMTGCTRLTEAKDNTPSTTGTPAETGEYGVYVRLELDGASAVYILTAAASRRCARTPAAHR